MSSNEKLNHFRERQNDRNDMQKKGNKSWKHDYEQKVGRKEPQLSKFKKHNHSLHTTIKSLNVSLGHLALPPHFSQVPGYGPLPQGVPGAASFSQLGRCRRHSKPQQHSLPQALRFFESPIESFHKNVRKYL